MKKELIIVGLVGALAIPTAAIAAGHGSDHKTRTPRTEAKGSAPRSGLAIRLKPSKNVPLGAKTRTSAKPKAGTRAGRNAGASPGRTRTSVRAKRNKTAGTRGVGVSLNQRKGAKVSGKKGIGGIGGLDNLALPISLDGLSI